MTSEPEVPPAGAWSYRVEERSGASVSALWPLLAEARRWQDWSFLTRTYLEREGSPDPDGPGAIRRFTRAGFGSREQVLASEPPHRLSYTILSGFPVRHYRSEITLVPEGDDTRIVWTARFDPLVPGTGRLTRALLRRVIGRFATEAARYAEAHRGATG